MQDSPCPARKQTYGGGDAGLNQTRHVPLVCSHEALLHPSRALAMSCVVWAHQHRRTLAERGCHSPLHTVLSVQTGQLIQAHEQGGCEAAAVARTRRGYGRVHHRAQLPVRSDTQSPTTVEL